MASLKNLQTLIMFLTNDIPGTRLSLDAMKKRLYIVKAYTNQDVQEESPPFFKVCISSDSSYSNLCSALTAPSMPIGVKVNIFGVGKQYSYFWNITWPENYFFLLSGSHSTVITTASLLLNDLYLLRTWKLNLLLVWLGQTLLSINLIT